MRSAGWLLVVAFAACPAHAQDTIEWAASRRLVRDDFKGAAPANAAHASLSWLNVEAAWECQGGALFATAKATFDPSRSWWRGASGSVFANASDRTPDPAPAQRGARRGVVASNLQLLAHEQLHFDIAEVAVRKVNRRFEEFDGACERSEGVDPVQRMLEALHRELQDEQQRYDRETRHGIDVRAQDRWTRRVRALLH